MYSHQIDMYRIMLLRIKRSVIRGGIIINAKPVLLLAFIELINDGVIENNQIRLSSGVIDYYKAKYGELLPNEKITPIYRPFFHLTNDGFWHLKMKNEITPERLTEKRLREATEYGYFDNVLWDILQMKDARELYTKTLIDNYLKS